jgi:hypothetical protein
MAYDAAHRVVVLFGGTGYGPNYQDTWTWDGSTWAKQSPVTSPDLSYGTGMAFDASTHQIVLHAFERTWTWDGTDWTSQQPGDSPTAREYAGMARERGHVLLFGGDSGIEDYHPFGDTWRWDGVNWTHLHPETHPAKRSGMGLAYDHARDQVVLFGGAVPALARYFRDTWTWDGATWTLLRPPAAPPARQSMGFVYDSAGREVVLFGGLGVVNGTIQYLSDTWTWDGTDWTRWEPP